MAGSDERDIAHHAIHALTQRHGDVIGALVEHYDFHGLSGLGDTEVEFSVCMVWWLRFV